MKIQSQKASQFLAPKYPLKATLLLRGVLFFSLLMTVALVISNQRHFEHAMVNVEKFGEIQREIAGTWSVLSTAAKLGSTMGGVAFENNYSDAEIKFHDRLKVLGGLAEVAEVAEVAASLQMEISNLDFQAFDLSRSQGGEAAQKILFGIEYETLQSKMNDTLTRLATVLDAHELSVTRKVSSRYKTQMTLLFSALLAEIISTLLLLRLNRHWGGQVAGINDSLEILVSDRTKELTEAQSIAKIGSWRFDLKESSLVWSSEHYKIFEIEEPQSHEKLYTLYRNRIHPDDLLALDQVVKRASTSGEGFIYDHRLCFENGRMKYVQGIGTVVKDSEGDPIRIQGTCQDMTERVLKEIETKKITQLLNVVLQNVPSMIFVKDFNKNLSFSLINKAGEDLVGAKQEELLGKTDYDFFPKEQADFFTQKDKDVFVGRKPLKIEQEEITTPKGKRFLETHKVPTYDSEGRPHLLIGISQDITEELMIRSQLELERSKSLRAAKLASLGEMSAGIAHEINNPLAIISGSAGLLFRSIDDPEKFANKVAVIQKSCERISKIILGLKKFSRTGDVRCRKPHRLSDIVQETLILTESKSKRDNTPVLLEYASNATINCDEVEIEQVLVNLINNAIDAVKDRADKWVKVSILEDGSTVVLQVMDSGPGIPESVRAKLFDPFFTTKKVGEGTGLGLSITKGILDEHQSTIVVAADCPHTCFEIRFPKAEELKSAA